MPEESNTQATDLLDIAGRARQRVAAAVDWRRILLFRAFSALLFGFHTTVALMALTQPELVNTGALFVVLPSFSIWVSATSAHLRTQSVVISEPRFSRWLSLAPFLATSLAFLFADVVLPVWALVLCGVLAIALEAVGLGEPLRRRKLAGTPRPTGATPPPETDWTLWVVALMLGLLCVVSGTSLTAVWALPALLVLPWFGWRGGRWPVEVFVGLGFAILSTYTAALLRGYLPGYSLVISIPLGVFATAAVTIPALIGHRR